MVSCSCSQSYYKGVTVMMTRNEAIASWTDARRRLAILAVDPHELLDDGEPCTDAAVTALAEQADADMAAANAALRDAALGRAA
jgi:hypothetical protein